MADTILIVDDEPFARQFLQMILEPMGFRILTATRIDEAEQQLALHDVDMLFVDIKMPGEDGLSWLARWMKMDVPTPRPHVVMMTGHGSIASAVQAMKLGATDYLEKPFESPEAVTLVVERVLARKRLSDENRVLRSELRERYGEMIGGSEVMQDLYQVLERIGPLPVTVLVRGESGTGKELVARSLHQRSARAKLPFLAINCAAIPEGLLESTLFGHEKGAFTGADRARKGYFEEAEGGTLFLDEIGDMSTTLQARLLRVLQEQTFTRVGGVRQMKANVRIVAATHRDLPDMVKEGTFREDLYYRLKVIELFVPPLRKRIGDVPLLADFFLQRTAARFGRDTMNLDPDLARTLARHTWPGNVRELEHAITRMVALAPKDTLTLADLPADLALRPTDLEHAATPSLDAAADVPLEDARARFEEAYLRSVLRQTRGKVSMAAEIAGIARQHLHRKLKRYEIDAGEYK